ncbi:MAG: ABC transporter permease [Defluviitaleaceae bacterium]|nr:ABC transporter permease [Defluviitaleaceae bacterium]
MSLTAKLAYSQITTNKRRTAWTLLGIILSTAMITAVFGFAASGVAAITELLGDAYVRDEYYATIYGMGGVMSVLIVAVSVIVVSNAFRVSAGERQSQFGLLKSVGATKKQIAQTVVYEGAILSVAGIPVGIIVGLLVQAGGVAIANHMLADLNTFQPGGDEIIFRFVFAWQGVLISVAVSFVTILLSAWFPARKAAKIAAIDAIRGEDEVKVKEKHIRGGRIVRKIFGFEGELASKSLKRSRRNFRATVVSLTISMILFIAASSFGAQLSQMTNLVFALIDADVVASFHANSQIIFCEDTDTSERRYMTISAAEAEKITDEMRGFEGGAEVFGVGGNMHRYVVPAENLTLSAAFDGHSQWERFPVTILTADAENYAELARRAGVPPGSNILINHVRTQTDGNWTEFAPIVFSGQTLQIQRHQDEGGGTRYIPLHGELRGSDVPNEIIHASASYVIILMPEAEMHYYFWAVQTDGPHEFAENVWNILFEMLPTNDDMGFNAGVFDQAAEDNVMRSLVSTIMIAIYGFVGMLTLIALTNVISTISTNVRSRSREFAVLQSVGMTHGGLGHMLNLESIFCSAKSLVFGLPLGVGVSYLLYIFMMESVWFPFEIPWLAIIQCVAAVFAITWIIMRYSAARLRDKSIIESIR